MAKPTFRAGTTLLYPRVMRSYVNGTAVYSGFCIELLDIIFNRLNTSYNMTLSPDGEWGDLRDGRWTGLMGMLVRQDIDITATIMSLTAARSQVADWTTPLYFSYSTVAVRKVHTTQGQWTAFLKPFTWQVYVCALCALLCCLCFLYGLTLSQRILLNRQVRSSFRGIVEFLLGSLLQQVDLFTTLSAMPHRWTQGASRTFVASWCLLSLLLAAFYKCQLTSLFVDVKMAPPFTSLSEMMTLRNFRWGAFGGSAILKLMRDSNNSVLSSVYEGLIRFSEEDPDVLSRDLEVHLAKLLEGDYAFIAGITTLSQLASRHCDIAVLDVRISGMEPAVFLTRKNWPVTKDIRRVMRQMEQSGILNKIIDKWVYPESVCDGNLSSSRAVTLATMRGPCYIAAGGLILAAGMLVLEQMFSKWMRKSSCFRAADSEQT